jgi:hypothetical protein
LAKGSIPAVQLHARLTPESLLHDCLPLPPLYRQTNE